MSELFDHSSNSVSISWAFVAGIFTFSWLGSKVDLAFTSESVPFAALLLRAWTSAFCLDGHREKFG